MLLLFINGLRSINKKWVQFFVLIVLIFLSVTVFSGINQSNRELLRSFSVLLDKGNSHHFSFYPLNQMTLKNREATINEFSDEFIKYKKDNVNKNFASNDVAMISFLITEHFQKKFSYHLGMRSLYAKTTNYRNKDLNYTLVLVDYYQHLIENNSNRKDMNKVIITEGRKPIASNEVIIFKQFAVANNLKIYDGKNINNPQFYLPGVGDVNNLAVTGLRIVGYGMTPDYVVPIGIMKSTITIPEFATQTFVYMQPFKFRQLAINKSLIQEHYYGQFNSGYEWNNIRKNEYLQLEKQFNELIGTKINYKAIASLETNDTVKPLFIQSRTNGVISTTFLFLILLIVFVIIIFLVKKDINDEKIHIGLLKAIGYRDWKISFSFLGLISFSSIVGSLLGYGASLFVQYLLSVVYANHIQLPLSYITFDWVIFLIVSLGPLLFLLMITYIFANVFLKKPPLVLLTPNISPQINGIKLFFLKLGSFAPFKVKVSFSLVIKSFSRVVVVIIAMISTTILLMFVFVTSTVVNDSINKSFSPINYHYNYFYDSSFLLQNDKKSFKYPFVKVEEINIKKLGLFDLLMLYADNKLQLETIFKNYYLPAPLLDLIYSQLNGFVSKIENSPVSEQEAIYNKLTMAINNLFSFKESVTIQQTQMVIENWFILRELADLSKTTKTDDEGNVRKVITTNVGFNFVPYQDNELPYLLLLGEAISNNNKALGSLMVHSVDFEHHKAFLKLEDENENNLYPLLEQELANWNEAKDINKPIPLVINSVMATLRDLKINDYFVIEFKYNDTIQKVNFKIVGIADFYQNSYVYAPLDAMRFVFGLDENSYNAKYSQQDNLEVQDWITLRTDGNNNLQGLKPLLNSLLDMSAIKQIALKYNNIIAIMIAIIIFFATTISVVILVMITNIVITENKKMIIVFQTLGYKIHEVSNIIMSAYIPTIIIAFLVGVPISIIILKELFIFVAKLTEFSLPVNWQWWHIIVGIAIELVVYLVSYFVGVFKLHQQSIVQKIKEFQE